MLLDFNCSDVYLLGNCKMPCHCGKTVRKPGNSKCRVRYCVCKWCNHCHLGYICPDKEGWYRQQNMMTPMPITARSPYSPTQSHGGHGTIPGCKNHKNH